MSENWDKDTLPGPLGTAEHRIWAVDLGESGGFYLEGFSTKETPVGSMQRKAGELIYGWFCIEVDTEAEVRHELTEALGFDAEEVGRWLRKASLSS